MKSYIFNSTTTLNLRIRRIAKGLQQHQLRQQQKSKLHQQPVQCNQQQQP